MGISMDERAHYVTQSSVYASPLLGKLTNRRIAKYQKAGYFTKANIVVRVEERKKLAIKKKRTKNDFLKELLKGLTL